VRAGSHRFCPRAAANETLSGSASLPLTVAAIRREPFHNSRITAEKLGAPAIIITNQPHYDQNGAKAIGLFRKLAVLRVSNAPMSQRLSFSRVSKNFATCG
jgi:hypothetical protein